MLRLCTRLMGTTIARIVLRNCLLYVGIVGELFPKRVLPLLTMAVMMSNMCVGNAWKDIVFAVMTVGIIILIIIFGTGMITYLSAILAVPTM